MPKVKKNYKRPVDILIVSDIHLGTYGCHSKELLNYLNSIKPQKIILNGDIIDIWQFSKRYWPKSHMQVIYKLIHWMSKGIKVYYITGNHDEMLRKFSGFSMGKFSIEDKIILEVDDKKVWIFHGDVFDITMQHSKWITKLGSTGYDMLILLNSFCNWVLQKMGMEKISLSKKIKNSVKKAVKFINDFEVTIANIAIDNKYDIVVCGHIHHPEMKTITNEKGTIQYFNSGDWVENLTAIEYYNGEWKLYEHKGNDSKADINEYEEEVLLDNKEIFDLMLKRFMNEKNAKIIKHKL
jgi:UDP-2,3-diacylglucosamine pyrophosphatase LpxH